MLSSIILFFTFLWFVCGYAAPQVERAGSPAQVAAEPTSTSESTKGGDLNALGHGGYICLHKTTFPLPDQWKSFDELVKINQDGLGPKASDIVKAIKTFTTSPTQALTAEDFQSLILAMVAQESNGITNLINDGGLSHGLLQVQLRNGEKPVACDPNSCTEDEIVKMLQQGVYGHSGTAAAEPPGIAYYLRSESPGPSLRMYNTGSLPDRGDYSKTLNLKSTQSYVSDVGNRLSGVSWKGFPNKTWLQQMCGFQPADQQQ